MFLPSIPVLSAPRAVLCALASVVLFATVPALIAQNNLAQTAEDEAVRRQELSILLRKTLKDAQSDQKLGDLGSAARLYEECWDLVQKIGDAGIEKERQETIQGFSEVYITLAKKSYSRAQYGEARTQVGRVLRVDPKNRDAQNLLASVEKALKEQEGRIPSKDTLALLPDAAKTKTEASTMVQDGKLLYEMGKLDEAEAKLRQAGRMDPDNAGAFYYLRLVEEARYAQEARKRELMAKSKMVEVEKSWNPPIKWGNITNTSNPFARTNTIYTSPSRRVIFNKLDKIRFAQYPVTGEMPGVPLGIVVKDLDEEVRLRDPEKRGINFIIAPNIDIQTAQPGLASFDPTTGQPISTAPQQEQFDLANDVLIKIEPPLKDIRLADLLDAIVKVSNKQIKYSVEDYAIVFTRKIPEQDQLFTRTFRVNPNTFVQGLEGVIGYPFEGANLANSSTGGGTTGGTTGGGFGGGGGYGGSGGYGGGGGFLLPRVDVTGYGGMGGMGGMGGGGGYGGGGGFGGGGGMMGGGMGGMGGGYGAIGYQSSGGSLMGVNRMSDMSLLNYMVQQYFRAAGVDLGGTNAFGGGGGGGFAGGQFPGGFQSSTGKAVFFNDRTGILMVRATLQDLDIVETALQVLNVTPDQVTIEVKFVEIGQDDTKALAFDWFLGQTMINGGAIGAAGGSYPSVVGRPSQANPFGVFPGVFGQPSVLPNAGTDQVLTSGLRTSDAEGNAIPAVGTITGILTDPQFRVVIRALEQRSGVDMLSAPKVTTVSGRQAQVQVVDIQNIVTSLNVGSTGGGTTTTTTGGTTGGGTVSTGGAVQ